MVITDKTFIVAGSRERIWEYLTKALLRSVPFEQIEFFDERAFSALLRLKMACFVLPAKVRVDISNISEKETLAARITLRAMAGILGLQQLARFDLSEIDKETTKVVVKLHAERMSLILRTVAFWKVRSFSRDSLDSVERLIKNWI